ncbi:hypothetical protein [Methylobacterium sp. J-076]|uniref:hypothetical protein n=1 Tax=Methylobacterium sp. J-076 TaxID=2836655 RepID=UPI001FBBD82A|nr:hypothetical protein [Methylobacterium sp. J-076]MCJ2012131.1 hypothetical protein [Methylobacterium sp. J-076]
MIRLAAALGAGLALALAAAALLPSDGRFGAVQPVGECPPPLKLAAGACVRDCPGGYEDRGRVCLFRNQAR